VDHPAGFTLFAGMDVTSGAEHNTVFKNALPPCTAGLVFTHT